MSVIPWPLDPVRGGGRRSTGALKHAMIEHMPSADDTAGLAAALIQSRQTILPKRLGAPGPNVAELAAILQSAAHAPDHGQLTPWRFVLVPDTSRTLLADVFAEALLERDPGAAPEQVEQAREKTPSPSSACSTVKVARIGSGAGCVAAGRTGEAFGAEPPAQADTANTSTQNEKDVAGRPPPRGRTGDRRRLVDSIRRSVG